MKNPRSHEFAKYRHPEPGIYGQPKDYGGLFLIEKKDGNLLILVSNGEGWDHVSVSLEDRCPTWEEMEFVKRLFFYPDEVCMQLHVAASKHLSFMPYCLHIWKPQNQQIPMPPSIMVAP